MDRTLRDMLKITKRMDEARAGGDAPTASSTSDIVLPKFIPKRMKSKGLDKMPSSWYGGRSEALADVVGSDEEDDGEEEIVTVAAVVSQAVSVYRKRQRSMGSAFGISMDDDKDQVEQIDAMVTEICKDLDDDQLRTLFDVIKGTSGFITGPGGVGKSHLVETIHRVMGLVGLNVVLTASTGIAAINLHASAMTINSFAMLGIGTNSKEKQSKISRGRRSQARWQQVDVLILDEVSMIKDTLLELVETAARYGKNKMGSVMGGVQIILVGDFYQLPPVVDREEVAAGRRHFAFQSPIWKEIVTKVWELRQPHRTTHLDFFNLLMRVRRGAYTDDDVETLSGFSSRHFGEGIEPTTLFAKRADVDRFNFNKLKELDEGTSRYFVATYSATIEAYDAKQGITISTPDPDSTTYNIELDKVPDPVAIRAPNNKDVIKSMQRLSRDVRTQHSIELREGAHVLFERNDTELGVVNGSHGVVIGFAGSAGYPLVRLDNDSEVTVKPKAFTTVYEVIGKKRKCVQMMQVPLTLAWSRSIHKSQAMSLEHVEVDCADIFERHMPYVAFSRATTPEGLIIHNLRPEHLRVIPEVSEFYSK